MPGLRQQEGILPRPGPDPSSLHPHTHTRTQPASTLGLSQLTNPPHVPRNATLRQIAKLKKSSRYRRAHSLPLRVRRSNVYDDSYQQLSIRTAEEMR